MKTIPLLLTTEEVNDILGKSIIGIASSAGLEKINQSNQVFNFVGWAEHQLILQSNTSFVVCDSPYHIGDILYVRETCFPIEGGYLYKASNDYYTEDEELIYWVSSNKMPRDAVRLFYVVIDIDYVNLKNTTIEDAIRHKSTIRQRYAWRIKLKRINTPKDFIS